MQKPTFIEETNTFHKNETMSQSRGLCNYLDILQLNPGSRLVLFNNTCSVLNSNMLFKVI